MKKTLSVWIFVMAILFFPLSGYAQGPKDATVSVENFDPTYSKCGVGVFRPGNGIWYYDAYHDGNTDNYYGPWGVSTDLPLTGDFNSDHGDLILDDVAVYRPSTGIFYYDYHHDGNTDARSPSWWGMEGDIPFGGDFDCDGHNDDVGVFRESNRTWYYDYNHDCTTNAAIGPWAWEGDKPIVGDFDRDACTDDVAVFRPSNHMWYYDYNHDGTTDEVRGPWGYAEDIPVACDFDGDGYNDDVAVFRPSNRTWYYDYDHNGTTNASSGPWGNPGDIPIAVMHLPR